MVVLKIYFALYRYGEEVQIHHRVSYILHNKLLFTQYVG